MNDELLVSLALLESEWQNAILKANLDRLRRFGERDRKRIERLNKYHDVNVSQRDKLQSSLDNMREVSNQAISLARDWSQRALMAEAELKRRTQSAPPAPCESVERPLDK